MRIEEILYTQGFGTRRVCAGLVQQGFVAIAGSRVDDPGADVETEGLRFTVQGKEWEYHEKAYLLLHKPVTWVLFLLFLTRTPIPSPHTYQLHPYI